MQKSRFFTGGHWAGTEAGTGRALGGHWTGTESAPQEHNETPMFHYDLRKSTFFRASPAFGPRWKGAQSGQSEKIGQLPHGPRRKTIALLQRTPDGRRKENLARVGGIDFGASKFPRIPLGTDFYTAAALHISCGLSSSHLQQWMWSGNRRRRLIQTHEMLIIKICGYSLNLPSLSKP